MRPAPEAVTGLVRISRYAGLRFDLIQAGGGNASVKLSDGRMLIKSSGCPLSEVGPERGWVEVDNRLIRSQLDRPSLWSRRDKRCREAMSSDLVKRAASGPGSPGRPSIETVMHSVLARYTLHTHPLVVNAVACRRDWSGVLKSLFEAPALVPYRTPGIDLALEVGRVSAGHRFRHGQNPKALFLQNHGLIVTADEPEDVIRVTEEVVDTLERHLSVDLRRYKTVTYLSELLRGVGRPGVENIVVLSEDSLILQSLRTAPGLFSSTPFCPDGLVYCGVRPLRLDGSGARRALARYRARYGEPPKVLIHGGHVYFVAPSLRKARETEDVFKFHLSVLRMAGEPVNRLTRAELAYLGNWESENYRQAV